MAAASSSSAAAPFFCAGDEDRHPNPVKQQPSSTPTSSVATTQPPAAPQKKRRNVPGNPIPDAEVIALSPKTLLATNRFICEVCNKGFQREQNLQLHRRGHNLPWKLRQKNPKEVRRKVYLCPEPTCAHHDPSRALGDLTGIKKHFCRKHGEKKWKCDKCSKRYAVQSDWKAHSKTCGTREYRCDCGTIFSRRDSFITHRAFCDVLAQENARLPTGLTTTIGSHLYGSSNNMALSLSHVNSQLSSLQDQGHSSPNILQLGRGGDSIGSAVSSQFEHLSHHSFAVAPHPPPPPPPTFFFSTGGSNQELSEENQTHQALLQNKQFHGLMQLTELQNKGPFNLSFFSNNNNNSSTSSNAGSLLLPDQFNNGHADGEPHTYLSTNLITGHLGMPSMYNNAVQNEPVLPQMSATALLQKAAQMGATTSGCGGGSLLRRFGSSSSSTGEKPNSFMEGEAQFHDLMHSLAFGGSGAMRTCEQEEGANFGGFSNSGLCDILNQSDGLTRDFLGVGGGMVRSIAGGINHRERQHTIGMASLDSDVKPATSSQRFGS